MEDTQWNDILRAKGIIKPSAAEEVETKRCDQLAGEQKKNTKDDFDELLDDDDELALREYRIKRLQQIKAEAMKNTFGEVREITKQDYVDEVNKAGDGVYVILHVYKPELPLCKLINKYLNELAQKFPHTKFLKSIAALCIPNYPDSNLPSIFVYLNGELKKQFIGESTFGGLKLKIEDLEWIISRTGAIETDLESDPRVLDNKKSKSIFSYDNNDDDDDDE